MLYIEDKSNKAGYADLKIEGVLNKSSLPILKNIVEQNLLKNIKTRLQLRGIVHCDREGIAFLRKYRDKLNLSDVSEFLKMELDFKS